VVGKVEAGASFGVPRGVKYGAVQSKDVDGKIVAEVGVWWQDLGGCDSEPTGLYVHQFDEGQVELVIEDGSTGESLELLGPGDVIDVGVGDEDLLEREPVVREGGDDASDVVAGINDDGLVGGFVAEDGAVTAKRADDENFMDHEFILEVSGMLG